MRQFILFILSINFVFAQTEKSLEADSLSIINHKRLSDSVLENIAYHDIDIYDTVEIVNGYGKLAVDSSVDDGTCYLRYDGQDWGDLDNDGQEDAIVTLAERACGSGIFIILVPVLNNHGIAVPLRPFELGDRVGIVDITIENCIATVTTLMHEDGEAMASEGSKKYIFRLQLKGNELQEVK